MALTTKQIETAIQEKRGNVAAVARSLGVSREAIYKQIRKYKTLQGALDTARETMLDNAETALYDQALEGNTTALIFFLKTQGKSRGYTERSELTGADGGAINIRDVKDMSDDELRAIING